MKPIRTTALPLLLTAVAATSALAQQPVPPAAAAPPSLIVMLTVDQLRPDYLTRWERQFTGGLSRLLHGGAVFLNGFQDHAITETAPGHASVLSGRFPASTGVVANAVGVQDPRAPLIGARGAPASPFRFRGTTLADWLREANPASRILSVSRKDRGAILPIGRGKEQVYWYASNGAFTTSSFYADTLPTWVTAFNARRLPHQYAGRSWTLLLDSTAYAEPDSVPLESGGRDYAFPHRLASDSAQAAAQLAAFPMHDDITLAFALEGVRQLELGAGPRVDLLAISLSATDAVGHRFGPDSRELHDQILRLDRALGAFLDTLFTLRNPAHIVIAMTSDHGVTPLPEARSRYPNQGAGRVNLGPIVNPLFASLRSAGVDTTAFAFEEGILILEPEALAHARLNVDAVARTFTTEVVKVRGVLRADRVRDLARRDTTTDYVARRWLHMLPPELPAAVVVTLRPYWYWHGVTFPTHGSPHDSDAGVPIVFYGNGIRPGRYDDRALVVDIAPTLAAIARVRPAERLDGRPLRRALLAR
ncbi:MAG TPA: alkaline phosphatase family protein [Gemmatimonadaceae bacterium]|nr:alkaline phosphatase family protein [Gemmatimonadaceae bacterium]